MKGRKNIQLGKRKLDKLFRLKQAVYLGTKTNFFLSRVSFPASILYVYKSRLYLIIRITAAAPELKRLNITQD